MQRDHHCSLHSSFTHSLSHSQALTHESPTRARHALIHLYTDTHKHAHSLTQSSTHFTLPPQNEKTYIRNGRILAVVGKLLLKRSGVALLPLPVKVTHYL
jgi:hypothetical protein